MSNKNSPKPQQPDGEPKAPADAERPRERRRPQPEREEQPIREDAVPRRPVLRFSPTAWAKLTWFCLYGETEIGGFAITDPDDPLYVIEFFTVKQQADWASIKFDDAAVADFFDQQVDLGRKPGQFGRHWLHTHPGDSPTPSMTDEETFQRVFGKCDWALMFVLARTGKTYARLRFNVGPGGHGEIPVEVDWSRPFTGTDHAAWLAEYEANIQPSRSQLTLLDAACGDPWDLDLPVSTRRRRVRARQETQPDEPFGADAVAVMADALDFDESWSNLLYQADWSELEAAAEKICVRWGLTDYGDWTEAVLSLSPDKQREFRQAVEGLLAERWATEVMADAG